VRWQKSIYRSIQGIFAVKVGLLRTIYHLTRPPVLLQSTGDPSVVKRCVDSASPNQPLVCGLTVHRLVRKSIQLACPCCRIADISERIQHSHPPVIEPEARYSWLYLLLMTPVRCEHPLEMLEPRRRHQKFADNHGVF
jgi:hypothetical protein